MSAIGARSVKTKKTKWAPASNDVTEVLFQSKKAYDLKNPKPVDPFVRILRDAGPSGPKWAREWPYATKRRQSEIEREWLAWYSANRDDDAGSVRSFHGHGRYDPGSTYWSAQREIERDSWDT